MTAPTTKPTVKLIGRDGHAFSIMGRVKKALIRSGVDKEYISQDFSEATSGDYNHLLSVSMEYVDIE